MPHTENASLYDLQGVQTGRQRCITEYLNVHVWIDASQLLLAQSKVQKTQQDNLNIWFFSECVNVHWHNSFTSITSLLGPLLSASNHAFHFPLHVPLHITLELNIPGNCCIFRFS
jgi:hypothetical protein